MKGNPVKFIYVSAGKTRPTPIDPDAIYFVESDKQIWVGNTLISDSVEPIDIESYLEPYRVKSIEFTGSGSLIADAALNDSTGEVVFTRTNPPVLSKGTPSDPQEIDLTPGSTFTVLNDITVSDHTIYDGKIKFKMPVQISSLSIRKATDGTNNVIIDTRMSDGTVSSQNFDVFGTAAFEDSSEFATAAQGVKADGAMQANGGTATSAKVTLANDPVQNMEAATKQYVDTFKAEMTGSLLFKGVSTTPITSGGREVPTIDGQQVDPVTLKQGDVVFYDNKEFVWTPSGWHELGDEGSFALKTTRVTAGDGLEGGGTLAEDMTISHGATGTGSEQTYQVPEESGKVYQVKSISTDEFGHVTIVESGDATQDFEDVVEAMVGTAGNDLNTALTNIQTDVQTNTTNITELQSDVSTNTSNIQEIQSDISTIQSDIDSIESDVADNTAAVSTLQSDVSTIQSEISDIQGDVSSLQEDVEDIKEHGTGQTLTPGRGIDITGDEISAKIVEGDRITITDDPQVPNQIIITADPVDVSQIEGLEDLISKAAILRVIGYEEVQVTLQDENQNVKQFVMLKKIDDTQSNSGS